MADIVAATGVARYGLYQEFGDKDELYQAALTRYRMIMRSNLLGPLLEADADLDTIEAHFERLLTMLADGDRRGCLACQAALDRGPADERVARLVADCLNDVKVAFANALAGASRKGQLRPLPVADLTDFLVGLVRTLSMLVRAETPEAEIRAQVRCSLALLKP